MKQPDPSLNFDRIARRVRTHIVKIASQPHGCHIGGSLSAVEVLTALYFRVLKHRPDEPEWDGRDYFIYSKGHASAALYGVLAEAGYFGFDELGGYCTAGSMLGGHPLPRVPGVPFATGAVGHGLSLGVGLAMGLRLRGEMDRRVFVLLGDGELQEGAVWEAVMSAAQFGLGNLRVIVDRNHGQNDGFTESINALGDVGAKFRQFGWAATAVDGHDIDALTQSLDAAPSKQDQPVAVIAETIKGRGVAFLEGDHRNHYASLSPSLARRALASVEAGL
jgi:transketolase